MEKKVKFCVDCLLPNGVWKKGSIVWPAANAEVVAASIRDEHPDWLVELNPVETEAL